MKYIIFLLFPFLAHGQMDTIFKKNGDTILGVITPNPDITIFYKNEQGINSRVNLSKVRKYVIVKDTLGLKSGKIEYVRIDSLIKGSKEDLYLRSKSWLVHYFKSANAVIQMDDKENGKLMGKGVFMFPVKSVLGITLDHDPIHYTIQINVKENKTRIIINDFIHEGGNYKDAVDYGSLNEPKCPKGFFYVGFIFNNMKKMAHEEAKIILNDYYKYMHSDSPIISDEF